MRIKKATHGFWNTWGTKRNSSVHAAFSMNFTVRESPFPLTGSWLFGPFCLRHFYFPSLCSKICVSKPSWHPVFLRMLLIPWWHMRSLLLHDSQGYCYCVVHNGVSFSGTSSFTKGILLSGLLCFHFDFLFVSLFHGNHHWPIVTVFYLSLPLLLC